ncbi:MAG: TolC family protein [Acidobacteriota bacterium]|nr:TolC family protein [Acidobacteriota bacterium]
MKNASHTRLLKGAAVTLLLTTAAFGQELRLGRLVSEALSSNPQILAAQKSYEAARQRPSQASALPDPMFSPGYTSNGNPLPGAQLGSNPTSAIGFMVSQELPYPGKRQLRGQIAAKEADAEFQSYQAVQLDVVSRLKQAYYRLAYDYSAIAILDRNRALLDKVFSIAEARYSAGKAAQQDLFKTQTQISVLEARKIALIRDRAAREAEIRSLVNRPPGQPLGIPPQLSPHPFAHSLDELYALAAKQAPLLSRGQQMIERAELAVNLAHKDYFPDVTVAGGYFNQGSMPPMYQFRVDIPLPFYYRRKQRAALAEQTQTLAGARRAYEATDQSLHFEIQDQYLLVDASWKLLELYSKTTVPQASLAFESSLASYETGAVDFLSVLTNYVSVFDYEMNYYGEVQNYYVAIAQLEEMTGAALVPQGEQQ